MKVGPLGNIARINHVLESMPKLLAGAKTKLETVERQLETAKVEVTKSFAQEAELVEKLERLSALNALLNMDKKGSDALGMDDEPEHDEKYELHRLLGALLSKELSVEEKLNII